MPSLSEKNQVDVIESFNSISRYLDDYLIFIISLFRTNGPTEVQGPKITMLP